MVKRLFILVFSVMIGFSVSEGTAQEAKVSKRKIEREHRRKEKLAEKNYKKAKKDHVKMQSEGTQSMMKKSRKEAKKKTPMKAPGGKKCK